VTSLRSDITRLSLTAGTTPATVGRGGNSPPPNDGVSNMKMFMLKDQTGRGHVSKVDGEKLVCDWVAEDSSIGEWVEAAKLGDLFDFGTATAVCVDDGFNAD